MERQYSGPHRNFPDAGTLPAAQIQQRCVLACCFHMSDQTNLRRWISRTLLLTARDLRSSSFWSASGYDVSQNYTGSVTSWAYRSPLPCSYWTRSCITALSKRSKDNRHSPSRRWLNSPGEKTVSMAVALCTTGQRIQRATSTPARARIGTRYDTAHPNLGWPLRDRISSTCAANPLTVSNPVATLDNVLSQSFPP